MNVEFPDVVLPAGSAGWVAPPGSGAWPSGDYRVSNVSGSIAIAPHARVRLLVTGNWKFTGNNGLTIGTNANLRVYLDCASADIKGNGIVNMTGTPNQCYIFGTSKLTTLDMGGNGETTAVVYAPYANVKLHGGGNSDQDFSGALVGKTFTFTGHYTVHYDEALGRAGAWRGFTITSWNEK